MFWETQMYDIIIIIIITTIIIWLNEIAYWRHTEILR